MQYRYGADRIMGVFAFANIVAAAPCDIYAAGKNPCVAAYGTTRAMYNAYTGPLYQVMRGSDNNTQDIAPVSAGGVANAASQDSFCANTTCTIPIIYDQSGKGNHLERAPPGGGSKGPNPGMYDDTASAVGAPVTLNGRKAYGVFVHSTVGYRNDATNGVATGNDPEGMYAIFDGTHYNDKCCFDFGNAETDNYAGADGTMETLYYGNIGSYGTGAGPGPWVMADMENGIWSGQNGGQNNGDPTIASRFVSAFLKGDSSNLWALRGLDATSSNNLTTYWSGPRPNGYYPMQKQGAVLLGIGGDNGNLDQGTWYEGVLTTGYPSDSTENKVQQNIAAARYATTSLATGPAITVGSTVTFHVTTPGFTDRFLAHSGNTVNTQSISSSSSTATQQTAMWKVHAGLASQATGCLSFESADSPGSYIHHSAFHLYVDSSDGSKQFGEDATFCPQTALTGVGTNTIRSWNYPTRFFRHFNNVGYVASNGGPDNFDNTASFNQDVTFTVGSGF